LWYHSVAHALGFSIPLLIPYLQSAGAKSEDELLGAHAELRAFYKYELHREKITLRHSLAKPLQ
jgi:hypothetical protein